MLSLDGCTDTWNVGHVFFGGTPGFSGDRNFPFRVRSQDHWSPAWNRTLELPDRLLVTDPLAWIEHADMLGLGLGSADLPVHGADRGW